MSSGGEGEREGTGSGSGLGILCGRFWDRRLRGGDWRWREEWRFVMRSDGVVSPGILVVFILYRARRLDGGEGV